MPYATGPTTTIKELYGLRWDLNPAVLGINKVANAGRSLFGPSKYLRMGPGNIITVPVKPINAVLSIINTYINFDLLVGQYSTGEWAGFIRPAVGVGQETGLVGILDTMEDYFSAINPALNLIPTPVVWGNQTVPCNSLDLYADTASWAGFSAAFSEAPTPGSPTVGALIEGYCTIRLPSVA